MSSILLVEEEVPTFAIGVEAFSLETVDNDGGLSLYRLQMCVALHCILPASSLSDWSSGV